MKLTSSIYQELCRGLVPSGLKEGEFVPLAAQSARRVSLEELQDPRSLERLYRGRASLQRTLSQAFALEFQVKEACTRGLETVENEIARLECASQFDLPSIHPAFLRWRNRQGYPAFSIYTLVDPVCMIKFARASSFRRADYTVHMSPSLPSCMSKNYLSKRLLEGLELQCIAGSHRSMELGARYAGAMPDEIRDRIHYYVDPGTGAPRFDEGIFIVAEAPVWSCKTVAQIRIGDPIVVGVKRNTLWVVGTYDLTDAEEMALKLVIPDDLEKN